MLSNMRKDIIEFSVAVDSKKNILKIFEFDGYVNHLSSVKLWR